MTRYNRNPLPNKERGFQFKPVMTYATTTMSICVAPDNLSAAKDHYDTHNDLCSTIMDTL
ncbi:hypothetical protein [Desulfotruncus arcticus]|uniref:hypothetical protein n=1 Tax=Desulfotruncus arcticus TaxID=341036 RepID=UPI00104220E2|nr:hypothetical protein [Desulfotruncus arcticus]